VHRPERTGVLKQDQYGFEKMLVLSAVLMGNERLSAALQEKEELLAKETLTDDRQAG
jgi:ATPase subunit of ABC transporter with duplicated ATPase domains